MQCHFNPTTQKKNPKTNPENSLQKIMAFQIPNHTTTISSITQKPILKIISLFFLFSLFYLFTYLFTTSQTTTTIKTTTQLTQFTNTNNNITPTISNFTSTNPPKNEQQQPITEKTESPVSPTLDFTPYHFYNLQSPPTTHHQPIKTCPLNFTNYCPCQDPTRSNRFRNDRYFRRERHCPVFEYEKLSCLIPRPPGYRRPFGWPKSRDTAWYNNVPFERLVVDKKKQNWVRLQGDRFVFPGGGTSFAKGVKGYIDVIKQILPLDSGKIRTALDVGCGVATFGAALLDYNILTMSVAPVDTHEAQVQFALERGLPAMIGILSTHRLPYPSRSFDLAHCSRCLVKWIDYDGLYLLEVDRILRPGGYWVLSGPPISWRVRYKGWERTREDLEKEQNDLENFATRMCWKKVAEKGPVAVWQKPTNHIHCAQKLKTWKSLRFCDDKDPDSAWYKEMKSCITPLSDVRNVKDTSGGTLQRWPARLNAVPPRITGATIRGITSRTFADDNQLWKRRAQHYGRTLTSLFKGGYRNIMDMNAGLGGFAAAMSDYPVWVMNAVPFDSENNTLGIIYERGLLGTYMNWCEAFSTYPRTYDLIHADGIFSIYKGRCDALDILLEMYRILRPQGAVIVRDHVDIIFRVKAFMEQMGWKSTLSHSERGPLHPEKVLFVVNSDQMMM